MRRAWILGLVIAAPFVAAAQATTPSVGSITFPIEPLTSTDQFINAEECRGGKISLDAQINPNTVSFATYQLYAANDKAESDPSKTDPCPTSENTSTGLKAGPVEALNAGTITVPFIADAEFSTSTIVAVSGNSCNASASIVLCIQAKASDNTTNVGTARVKLALVIDKPNTPTLTSVTFGEQALNVKWDAPNPVFNESYEVVATTTDPLDPALVHTSARVTATSLRFGGLVNGVTYSVQVRAFSDADNPSDLSNAMSGTPDFVNDFWETYKDAGGREQGGCASGAAGTLALLAMASLVALRRRK